MKLTGKVTLLTAALFALSAHAVAAETVHSETTAQPTTVEVTTVQPTTEKTTTSDTSLPKDSKNDVDIRVYKPGEEPKYTGILKADGETYYQVDSKPITNTWKWHGGRWYYFGEDGKMLKSTVTPDGYLVDIEGMLVSPGWNYQGGKWYYAESGGKVFRGDWKKIGGIWYAFHNDGVMYSHEWNDVYFLKDSGEMADNEWVFDRNYNSWFYIKPGGSYASSEWKGDYYLKTGGYMAKSEFIYDPNYKATYYLKEEGSYARNQWLQVKGKWYHFRKYGELDTNKWIGSYYVNADGMMAENEFIYDPNYKATYYLKEDGSYARNQWLQVKGKWYHFRKYGEMDTSKWVGSYYVKSDGVMGASELVYDPTYNSSFYFDKDGNYLNKQWKEIDGDWYYFKDGGYMAKNEWVGSYFIKGNGRMAKNEMQYDQSTGSSYYFKEDGTFAKNYWAKVGDYWYYFKANGKVAQKEWIENKYYVFDNGKMATGTHIIDHYQYVFDGSGNVLSKKAVDIGWVEKNGKRYFYNGASQRLGDETAKKVMDVSEHQGHISNWEGIIKDNDIDAVIVRIGYSGAEDKHLANNISELNRLDVPYGIYLYTYAATEADGVEDAEQTIALIKKYNIKPTYPIYFDIEDWRYKNGTKSAPTDTATWVKIWNAYRDTLAKAGYTNVRIYSYQYLLQNRLNTPEILKYVDWVAAYTPQLKYQLPYSQPSWGWQYTDKEFIPGLGNVDMSVWFGR